MVRRWSVQSTIKKEPNGSFFAFFVGFFALLQQLINILQQWRLFMHDYLIAFILGIVEGITEFLPISSTGHLILLGDFLQFSGDDSNVFEVVIQLGATLAIVILYFRRYLNLFSVSRFKTELNMVHLLLGMLPAGILGLLFHDFIKDVLFSSKTVVFALILGALLMIYADKKSKPPVTTTLNELTYKQALSIGLFQILALFPGFSRSGSTMSGGMLVRVDTKTAADFSFFIAAPMMFAASLLDIYKNWDALQQADLNVFIIGFVTSFIVALIAIPTFLKLLKQLPFSYFAYYRIVLAVICMFFLF